MHLSPYCAPIMAVIINPSKLWYMHKSSIKAIWHNTRYIKTTYKYIQLKLVLRQARAVVSCIKAFSFRKYWNTSNPKPFKKKGKQDWLMHSTVSGLELYILPLKERSADFVSRQMCFRTVLLCALRVCNWIGLAKCERPYIVDVFASAEMVFQKCWLYLDRQLDAMFRCSITEQRFVFSTS